MSSVTVDSGGDTTQPHRRGDDLPDARRRFRRVNFIAGDAQPVLGDIEAAIQLAVFSDDEHSPDVGSCHQVAHASTWSFAECQLAEGIDRQDDDVDE